MHHNIKKIFYTKILFKFLQKKEITRGGVYTLNYLFTSFVFATSLTTTTITSVQIFNH